MVAGTAGLRLRQCGDSHYQLEPFNKKWLQNIYPGNWRLYFDRNRPQKPPYLNLPEEWTLTDVVMATIAALR